MPYKIKCWIPVDVDPEEEQIYESKEEANSDLESMAMMQEENRYEITECDEDGIEVG